MNAFFYWSGVIAWMWIVGVYLVWPLVAAISLTMIHVCALVYNCGWGSIKWVYVPKGLYNEWKEVISIAIPASVSHELYTWRGVFNWEIKDKRFAMREKGQK